MEERFLTKNGVEIFGYRNPSQHGFFISLFLRSGSMYESDAECGMTHFFEHVAIRNVNKQMNGRLYPDLDRLGVEFNATTYVEMVQFYTSGASDKFSFAARALTHIFSPITLSAEEIDAERRRIKAEIREDDKNSLSSFTNGIVHEKTSLSHSITGTLSNVGRINAKRLEEYRKRILTRDNAFFYVTGSFTDGDIAYLAECIEKYNLAPSGSSHENIAPVSANHFKRDGAVHVKNADFTVVRFTFDIDMKKHSVPVTDLLYDLLLTGYNSRLFMEMSETRGLFYDISGTLERYRNIGELYFSYELRGKDIAEAVALTVDILNSIKREAPGEEEMMRAGYVDNAGMLLDDSRELNFTMAYDAHVMGLGYRSLEDRMEAYASVTPDDIKRAACEIFTPENLILTIKGNKKKINAEELNSLIRGLKQ